MTGGSDFPTLDPQLAAVRESLPDFDLTDVSAARELAASSSVDTTYDGVDLLEVTADGVDGGPDVAIRLMRPAGVSRALPVLLAMHGGAWVLGRASDFDYFCVDVVRSLGIAVANVDYRLAPETPFPGPLDDCYAALLALHENASEWGVDPTRIAVGGSSAGGGLAAGVALRTRDEGGPRIAFQLLLSPGLDDRLRSASATAIVDAPVLSRETAELAWVNYLGPAYTGPDDPAVSPYAVPARARDVSGLPPTYIAAMELDPVRDDNIGYALRLLEAGVSVELHSHPGTFHGSVELVPEAESSKRIQRGLLDALARGLAVPYP